MGPKNIFSGDCSEDLWKAINKIFKQRKRKRISKATFWAVYIMGCRLQELEAEFRELQRKVKDGIPP